MKKVIFKNNEISETSSLTLTKINVPTFKFFKFQEVKPIDEILLDIKKLKYATDIESIRRFIKNGQQKEANDLKKKLLAFTVCATYGKTRKAGHELLYNQLIVLDFDDIDLNDLQNYIDIINACPHTYTSFVSPSGRGIKVIVPVNSGLQHHKHAFQQVADFYSELLDLTVDPSGSDPSRLCYVSYDPELFLNKNALVFEIDNTKPFKNQTDKTKNYSKTFEKCVISVQQKHDFKVGSRNNFVFALACECNKYGLDKETALSNILEKYSYDDNKEIYSTVESAYINSTLHCTNNLLPIQQIEKYLKAHFDTKYNIVTNQLEYCILGGSNFYKTMNDYDFNSILRDINNQGIRCNSTTLHSILNSNFSDSYNPFIEYFSNLPKWDGIDYLQQLADTVTTTNKEYWEICIKKWMVALVGCAINDDIVNQTVIVMSGKQGAGKTSWVHKLLPNELANYKFDGTIDPSKKDTLVNLEECLLINMDELENLNKSDIGELKSIITQKTNRMRRAYGRFNQTNPRRASLIGSINGNQFLNDSTGSRRFLCQNIIEINYKHFIDIDKVYAQCIHLLEGGFQYWFDKDEIALVNKNNEDFEFLSIEEQELDKYFKPIEWGYKDAEYYTSSEILRLLNYNYPLGTTPSNLRILGQILAKKRYIRGTKNGIKKYALELLEPKLKDVFSHPLL
jgi:predicted P-loop ATPase